MHNAFARERVSKCRLYCSGVKYSNNRHVDKKRTSFFDAVCKICLMVWSDRHFSTSLYFQCDTSTHHAHFLFFFFFSLDSFLLLFSLSLSFLFFFCLISSLSKRFFLSTRAVAVSFRRQSMKELKINGGDSDLDCNFRSRRYFPLFLSSLLFAGI